MTAQTPPDEASIKRYIDAQEEQNRIHSEMLAGVKTLGEETKAAVEQMRDIHEQQVQWWRDIRNANYAAEAAGQKPAEAAGQLLMAFFEAGPGASKDAVMRNLADVQRMPAERYKEVENAMSTHVPSGGGVFFPPTFFDEMIPFFRVTPSLFALGVRNIMVGEGATHIPRMISGTAASWTLENAEVDLATEPKWGSLELTPKKVGIRLRMSTSFARSSSAAQSVAQDAIAAMAQEWSSVAMNGSGQKRPTGLFVAPLAGKLAAFSESIDVKERKFWARMKKAFRKANKGQVTQGLAWVFNEDVTCRLEEAETGLGMPKYNLDSGKHLGFPYHEDFQLITTSATPDTTQIALGAWSEFFVAMSRQNVLQWSPHSRFSYDQLEMMLISEGDCGPRQLKAFCLSSTGIVEDVA